MKTRRVKCYRISLLAYLRLHLNLEGLRCVIPNLDEPLTDRDHQLLPLANVHAGNGALVKLLMHVREVGFFRVGPVQGYVHFHKLPSLGNEVQHVLRLVERHTCDVVQEEVGVFPFLFPDSLVHHLVRKVFVLVSLIGPDPAVLPAYNKASLER